MNYKEIQKRNEACQAILANGKLKPFDKLEAIVDICRSEIKERYPDLYTEIKNYLSLRNIYNLTKLLDQFNQVSDKLRDDIVFLYYVILEIRDENICSSYTSNNSTYLPPSAPRGLVGIRMGPFMYSGSYLSGVFSQDDLVTNFNKKLRPLYERAISEYKNKTGKDILFIKDEAYWNNGHLDERMNSLHIDINARCDLTEFWDIYHALEMVYNSKFDNDILSRQLKRNDKDGNRG